MNNRAKYLNFEKRFDSVEQISSFFGVSIPTIRKWQLIDTKIPKYAFRIIDLETEREAIANKEVEALLNFNQLKLKIKKFFELEKDLKETC